MPLFRFVKAALIRRFGEAFYHQLDAAYEALKNNKSCHTSILIGCNDCLNLICIKL